MQIIWNQQAAESLRNSHTVLELETFAVGNQTITAYCVIPPEKVFPEITRLDNIKELHQAFITAFNNQDYKLCQDLVPELVGRFGGELDDFYTTVIDKITKQTNRNS